MKDRILVFPASYDFDFVWIAERHYPYLRMDSDVDDVRLLFENDHSKSILIIIPESIFYGLVLDCIEWIPWQTRKKVCAAQYHCGELYTSFIAASLLKKGFLEIKNESWYSFFLTEEKHS